MTMNAVAMVNRCLRHQMPELWDRPEVAEPHVPSQLRYGSTDYVPSSQESLPEERMGDPEAIPW